MKSVLRTIASIALYLVSGTVLAGSSASVSFPSIAIGVGLDGSSSCVVHLTVPLLADREVPTSAISMSTSSSTPSSIASTASVSASLISALSTFPNRFLPPGFFLFLRFKLIHLPFP